MNEYAILAFVVTPLTVAALGWAYAVWVRRRADHAR